MPKQTVLFIIQSNNNNRNDFLCVNILKDEASSVARQNQGIKQSCNRITMCESLMVEEGARSV